MVRDGGIKDFPVKLRMFSLDKQTFNNNLAKIEKILELEAIKSREKQLLFLIISVLHCYLKRHLYNKCFCKRSFGNFDGFLYFI